MKNSTKRSPIAALLLLGTLASLTGCVVIAGAGIGYIISREVGAGGTHEARLDDEVEHVWAVALESLEILIDPNTELTRWDTGRGVTGQVDRVEIQLAVEAYDYNRTILRVTSKDLLGAAGSSAERVMDYVLKRLSASRAERDAAR